MRTRAENQMLLLRVMAAVVPIASALFIVSAAAADDRETCIAIPTKSTIDLAIAACTRAIVSGQYSARNLVTLHASRAIAYAAKWQYDRASQDFDRATRLDPRLAQGYRTDPVGVGDGRYIFCCRAILFDCRTKTAWRPRHAKGSAHEPCVQTCVQNLKC
jgi:hypothetical protein